LKSGRLGVCLPRLLAIEESEGGESGEAGDHAIVLWQEAQRIAEGVAGPENEALAAKLEKMTGVSIAELAAHAGGLAGVLARLRTAGNEGRVQWHVRMQVAPYGSRKLPVE